MYLSILTPCLPRWYNANDVCTSKLPETELLERVTEMLTSLAVDHCVLHASRRIVCVAYDEAYHTVFNIKFYSTTNHNDPDLIHIEMQRRSGCPNVFRFISRSIRDHFTPYGITRLTSHSVLSPPPPPPVTDRTCMFSLALKTLFHHQKHRGNQTMSHFSNQLLDVLCTADHASLTNALRSHPDIVNVSSVVEFVTHEINTTVLSPLCFRKILLLFNKIVQTGILSDHSFAVLNEWINMLEHAQSADKQTEGRFEIENTLFQMDCDRQKQKLLNRLEQYEQACCTV